MTIRPCTCVCSTRSFIRLKQRTCRRIAALSVVGASLLSVGLMFTTTLAAPGWMVDPATNAPVADLFPGTLRLLTPFLNITGGLALAFGAVFSAYVFMPKRRILDYSLDPTQPGDVFLFNLAIAPVAIGVNLAASLPGAFRALVAGRLHSRVPATILIAIGAFLASSGDTLARFGNTEFFVFGKLLSVIFLFVGFLVSVEACTMSASRSPGLSACGGRLDPSLAGKGRRAPEDLDAPRHSPVTLPRGRLGGSLAVACAACLFGTLGPASRGAYDAGGDAPSRSRSGGPPWERWACS